MRLKRSTKEYGGGSGHEIFESDLFRVLVWKLSNGVRTTIDIKLGSFMELNFDGKQELTSDELCMEQLTCEEIIQMINHQKEESFEEGKESKAQEILSCLGIR